MGFGSGSEVNLKSINRHVQAQSIRRSYLIAYTLLHAYYEPVREDIALVCGTEWSVRAMSLCAYLIGYDLVCYALAVQGDGAWITLVGKSLLRYPSFNSLLPRTSQFAC